MSFASDVRGELARVPVSELCCATSEVIGALLCGGGIAWRGRERYALTITSAEAPTVRRYFGMLKQFWGVVGQIRTITGDGLNNQTRYQLAVPEADTAGLLDELGLLDAGELFGVRQLPKDSDVRFTCCRKAFLRAAFLMCGAMSNPEKSSHIEFAAPTEGLAAFIIRLTAFFELDLKSRCRKSKYVAYLKKAEGISDMLSLMGASRAMMAFENVRVKKEVSNRVNRQLNCDNFNINRVMKAAEMLIDDIRYIDEQIGLDRLPKPLREMAFARANNPETSLADLGEMMDPPLSKSGVSARLRRLEGIAEKLRCGDELKL